jgi:hypothetical protein
MQARFGPLLTYNEQGKEMDSRSPSEMAVGSAEKDIGGQTPRLHGVSCESVDWNPYAQFNWFSARRNVAVQFFD